MVVSRTECWQLPCSTIKPDELWVAFSTESNFQCIPVHELASVMNPMICAALPVFYAFAGCTVFSFWGKGKETV